MIRFLACRSLQNSFFSGKDELAGTTPTEGNEVLAILYASIFLPTIALLVVVGFAIFSVARYLKNNLQQIFRTVLDFKPLCALALAFIVPQQYEGLWKRSLKIWSPDVYHSKTHLKYYNFFQKCKDHFTTAGAKGQNLVLFASTFFKNTALFCWQQDQRKVEDETNIFIT